MKIKLTIQEINETIDVKITAEHDYAHGLTYTASGHSDEMEAYFSANAGSIEGALSNFIGRCVQEFREWHKSRGSDE